MSTNPKVVPKVLVKKFKPFENLDDLPSDLRISTITVTCKLDTVFHVDNIGKYIDLTPTGIISIKHGRDVSCNRSLEVIKRRRTKKEKKPKKVFYNQATVEVYSKYKKKTNVKLFNNGSIQMTGCISRANCIDVLIKLFNEFKRLKTIVDPKSMKKLIAKPFVGDISKVDISKIQDLSIRMINSNFNVGFKIDREKLYKLLLKQKIDCSYEPCVHACVNIKYNYKDISTISIFVFESGAIIITGAKERDHIIQAYKFITKKLFENYNIIIKEEIDELQSSDIKEFMIQENNNKKNIKSVDISPKGIIASENELLVKEFLASELDN